MLTAVCRKSDGVVLVGTGQRRGRPDRRCVCPVAGDGVGGVGGVGVVRLEQDVELRVAAAALKVA